jgi:hypothetical protein
MLINLINTSLNTFNYLFICCCSRGIVCALSCCSRAYSRRLARVARCRAVPRVVNSPRLESLVLIKLLIFLTVVSIID